MQNVPMGISITVIASACGSATDRADIVPARSPAEESGCHQAGGNCSAFQGATFPAGSRQDLRQPFPGNLDVPEIIGVWIIHGCLGVR